MKFLGAIDESKDIINKEFVDSTLKSYQPLITDSSKLAYSLISGVPSISISGKTISLGGTLSQEELRSALGLGSNAYSSTSYLPLTGGTVANVTSSKITTNELVVSGNQFIYGNLHFMNPGTGTFDRAVIIPASDRFAIEAPFSEDNGTSSKLPLILTWRGGYDATGGLKLTGGSNGYLGGYQIWHKGNFEPSNYLPLTGGTLNNYLTINIDGTYGLFLENTTGNTCGIQLNVKNKELSSGIIIAGGDWGVATLNPTAGYKGIGVLDDGTPYFGTSSNKNTIWHSGNFNPSNYLPLSGGTITSANYAVLNIKRDTTSNVGIAINFLNNNGAVCDIMADPVTKNLKRGYNSTTYTIWDSGNDGANSGLDADLLDGVHASGLFTGLSTLKENLYNLSITIGGTTKKIGVNYLTYLDSLGGTAFATVKQHKDKLLEIFGAYGHSFGNYVMISNSVVQQWNDDNASTYNHSTWSFIKISPYTGSDYGQWLLSSYGSNRIGYVGRDNGSWTDIRWIATTADLANYLPLNGNAVSATNATYLAGVYEYTNVSLEPGKVHYSRVSKEDAGSLPASSNANGIMTFNTHDGNYHHQIGLSSNGNLYHRPFIDEEPNTTKEWKQIAYTTSNVASATKIQTARTLWGQSFDGTGNINGDITLEIGTTSYNVGAKAYFGIAGRGKVASIQGLYTSVDWNASTNYAKGALVFSTYNSDTINTAMYIDHLGNIGIGTTNPSHKLHVEGDGYFNGSVNVSGNIVPSSSLTYNLGTSSSRWNFINAGAVNLTSDNSWLLTLKSTSSQTAIAFKNSDDNTWTASMYSNNNFQFIYNSASTKAIGFDTNGLITCNGYAMRGSSNDYVLLGGGSSKAIADLNVLSATKLANSRKIWGQSFDGTSDISSYAIFDNNTQVYFKDSKNTNIGCIGFTNGNDCLVGYGTASEGYKTVVYGGGGIIFVTGTSRATAMTINSSGNVTIGPNDKALANHKLYVDGTVYINNKVSQSNTFLTCMDESLPNQGLFSMIFGKAADAYSRAYMGYRHVADGSNLNRIEFGLFSADTIFNILASGNVGIGTSSPSAKLHVSGDILATGGVTSHSMRSLKNIVDERGLSLEELSTIKPTRYTWKDGRDDRLHIGGIADDVIKVLPEVVYKANDGTLTMDYGNAAFAIASSLIKPVSEHERRIKALEDENEKLKKEIEILKWNIA